MAYEPKAKKGDLSKKLRKVIATGLLAVAAVGTAAPAQADWLDDIKGTVIKNAGGQIQNLGTEQANKLKCETVDGGIWQQSTTSSGGYSASGKSYKGAAAGRTSGKCLTGSQKTRYIQQMLRPEITATQATLRAKANENKGVCQMVITDRQQANAVCGPLGREGNAVAQTARAATSLEDLKAKESKFVQASDTLQECLASGSKAPVRRVMDYNKNKM